ncbi:ABC transporter permease [Egicoccus sp. AB-alg6-2]|uniref:ABC transporter permease n=1 Tax=Egicoccus sp. AB-alg6-2 TaxID=3242692 RepID=UPI00359E6209
MLVPAAFLLVFFVLPVGTILLTGLRPEGRVDLGALPGIIGDPVVARVAWFTLWQAAASTALTLLVGLPGAYVLARMDFPGRNLLRAAITVPFVLPTVVVGSAFLALLGPRSPLNTALVAVLGDAAPALDLRRTVTAILIAHVFFNYAVIVRTVGGLWSHLDPRLEEAARTLGASRWQVFREVSWPLVRPAVSSAAAIVFLFTFTSFGVVLILGGPARATLEVEIYRATVQLLDLPLASVLALLQLAAVTAALLVYGRLQRRATSQPLRSAASTARRVRTRGERAFLGANLLVVAVLLLLPLAVLVERSLATGAGYGFDHYAALFGPQRNTVLAIAPVDAIRNSVVYGLGATVVALVVGGCAAVAASRPGWPGRALDRALMLPLGTSAATVGFGFLLALARPPLDLRGSRLLIPAAQALIAVPFVVRTLLPVLRSIDQRLREAAATLGAPPRRVWREVDFPIVGRAAMAAAGFSFAIAVGEFGATVFLARGQTPTMPVAIFRLLGRPGVTNFGQAMAMATILMLVTAAAIALIDRLRVGQVGRF